MSDDAYTGDLQLRIMIFPGDNKLVVEVFTHVVVFGV